MQSQLVCNGCRSVLHYPRGATNVCCALCNTITSVPPRVDDARLLLGIHYHGFGNWEKIRLDERLGLMKKIAPVELHHHETFLPRAPNLRDRANALLEQVHKKEGCNIRRNNNNEIYTKGHKVLRFTKEFFKHHVQSQKVLSIIEESQK